MPAFARRTGNNDRSASQFFTCKILKFLLPLLVFQACSVKPAGFFSREKAPTPPNYSLAAAWAALPFTVDAADRTPGSLVNLQSEAPVDVFFLHPTTYTGKRGHEGWNGPIYNRDLQERTDGSTILYQASLFNGVGRVFAPRYRQAHLHAYFTDRREWSAKQAFELAYGDIRAAFEYYLNNYNDGRPIIIAAHSQGTTHAKRLLRDYFDGHTLQEQLVVAYLAGIPVKRDAFQFIKVCGSPEEIGCFCSWRTWRRGRTPKDYAPDNDIAVTNPLNWATTEVYAPPSRNQGAVLSNFDKLRPKVAGAVVHDGLLWIDRPKFPWSFLYLTANYRIADFNLFYMNVRENARRRVKNYLELVE